MSEPAPVLLVHGLATSAARTWGETGWLDLLADEGRRVIAPDLPGHAGAPFDPAAPLDVHDAVLAHFPEGRFDAVGFSLGARTLLWLAAQHPGRIGRLVVAGVGANLFRSDDHRPLAEAIERAAGLRSDADPAVDEPDPTVAALAHHFTELAHASGTDPAVVAKLLGESDGRTLDAELLAGVDADVLVVLGTEDFAGPADPLLDALPTARLVELPGVDHFATPKSMRFLDAGLRFLS